MLCHVLYHFYVALQKHTPEAHPDHACLNNAVEKMKETLRLLINLYANWLKYKIILHIHIVYYTYISNKFFVF